MTRKLALPALLLALVTALGAAQTPPTPPPPKPDPMALGKQYTAPGEVGLGS